MPNIAKYLDDMTKLAGGQAGHTATADNVDALQDGWKTRSQRRDCVITSIADRTQRSNFGTLADSYVKSWRPTLPDNGQAEAMGKAWLAMRGHVSSWADQQIVDCCRTDQVALGLWRYGTLHYAQKGEKYFRDAAEGLIDLAASPIHMVPAFVHGLRQIPQKSRDLAGWLDARADRLDPKEARFLRHAARQCAALPGAVMASVRQVPSKTREMARTLNAQAQQHLHAQVVALGREGCRLSAAALAGAQAALLQGARNAHQWVDGSLDCWLGDQRTQRMKRAGEWALFGAYCLACSTLDSRRIFLTVGAVAVFTAPKGPRLLGETLANWSNEFLLLGGGVLAWPQWGSACLVMAGSLIGGLMGFVFGAGYALGCLAVAANRPSKSQQLPSPWYTDKEPTGYLDDLAVSLPALFQLETSRTDLVARMKDLRELWKPEAARGDQDQAAATTPASSTLTQRLVGAFDDDQTTPGQALDENDEFSLCADYVAMLLRDEQAWASYWTLGHPEPVLFTDGSAGNVTHLFAGDMMPWRYHRQWLESGIAGIPLAAEDEEQEDLTMELLTRLRDVTEDAEVIFPKSRHLTSPLAKQILLGRLALSRNRYLCRALGLPDFPYALQTSKAENPHKPAWSQLFREALIQMREFVDNPSVQTWRDLPDQRQFAPLVLHSS